MSVNLNATNPDLNDFMVLFLALCKWSTNNNPAFDAHRRKGILAITPAILSDANQEAKKLGFSAFTLDDCLSPDKSYQVFTFYLHRYGQGMSVEQLAKIWLGGPSGATKNKGEVQIRWQQVKWHILFYYKEQEKFNKERERILSGLDEQTRKRINEGRAAQEMREEIRKSIEGRITL